LWTNKEIFHCNKCGICRVGKELYHCDDCGMCYKSKDHDCKKKITHKEDKCPVCQEIIFFSIKESLTLKCGHKIHSDCYGNYLKSNFNCPICKKSIYDMTESWNHRREYRSTYVIPDELKDFKVNISCYDCGKKNEIKWYPDGLLECSDCGSFNTQKI
jgi:RING finger/CHY zinc finger protein 1